MPKKKLTKTQVRKKMQTCANAMYDLILDKMGHSESGVPVSMTKLLEIHKLILSAKKRVK
jgi:hypothetical protein